VNIDNMKDMDSGSFKWKIKIFILDTGRMGWYMGLEPLKLMINKRRRMCYMEFGKMGIKINGLMKKQLNKSKIVPKKQLISLKNPKTNINRTTKHSNNLNISVINLKSSTQDLKIQTITINH